MRAKPISELMKELHVFSKGSFFNEGEYDDNKVIIQGYFYQYSDTYSNNVNFVVQLPPTHHDNPKFRTATHIVPFFTEGKIRSGGYLHSILLHDAHFRVWSDYNWIDIIIYNVSIAKTYNSSYLLHQIMYLPPNFYSLAYGMLPYEGLVLYFYNQNSVKLRFRVKVEVLLSRDPQDFKCILLYKDQHVYHHISSSAQAKVLKIYKNITLGENIQGNNVSFVFKIYWMNHFEKDDNNFIKKVCNSYRDHMNIEIATILLL